MPMQESYDAEKKQIESVADTKGIEVDKIEVSEGTNDDGDTIVQFRVYETYSDDPNERVAVPISKMRGTQMSDVSFREDINRKLSKLQRYLRNDQSIDEVERADQTGKSPSDDTNGDEQDDTQSSRTRTRASNRANGDGPGAQLDAEIEAIHDRLDDFEERLEALEQKGEALDGLQQLMNQGNDGS